MQKNVKLFLALILVCGAFPLYAHKAELQRFFGLLGVELPDAWYFRVAESFALHSKYDGEFRPVCLDAAGDLREIQAAPGQLLSVAAGDPAIKDRSLAALASHWYDYYQPDFTYECEVPGLAGKQMCSPVSYYYAYQKWRASDRAGPPPPPSLFLHFPSHIAFGGEYRTAIRDIYELILHVESLPDPDQRLLEMHKIISWLKGDARVTEIAGRALPPLLNNHFSGMGKLFVPAMMFPEHAGADNLPRPSLATGLGHFFKKLVEMNPDYSGAYSAQFSVGLNNADYHAFVNGSPWAVMYEDLRYTDDPITLRVFGLRADAAKGENVFVNRAGMPGFAVRAMLYASAISTHRDRLGRATVNDHVQRPPSGICLEESAYFLHASMLHTLDGWAVAAWSADHHMMPALVEDFLALHGIAARWNKKYADYPEKTVVSRLPPVAHMEIWDSHIYIPHGDIASVRARLNELRRGDLSRASLEALGYQVPADWPCTGAADCPANPCANINCTKDNLGLKPAAACAGDAACLRALAAAFSAPYVGPLSRRTTGLAPAHRSAETLASYDDPIAETMRDRVACDARVDEAAIPDGCAAPDVTPVPPTGFNKSAVPGEMIAFTFNHLWTSGAMTPVHMDGDNLHIPRYMSMNGENDAEYPGFMSFRRMARGAVDSFPDPALYGTLWFVNDTYGYFRSLPEVRGGDGKIDLARINRSGRGDAMYQLQYFPQRFLFWKSSAEFDEDYGSNLPRASFGDGVDMLGSCMCL